MAAVQALSTLAAEAFPKFVQSKACLPLVEQLLGNNADPLMYDATWGGLTIHSAAADAEYKVCYNKGLTFDRYQWYEVPGRVEVRKATFTCSLTVPAHLTALSNTPELSTSVVEGGGMAVPSDGLVPQASRITQRRSSWQSKAWALHC